jgi:hypothetical protein
MGGRYQLKVRLEIGELDECGYPVSGQAQLTVSEPLRLHGPEAFAEIAQAVVRFHKLAQMIEMEDGDGA